MGYTVKIINIHPLKKKSKKKWMWTFETDFLLLTIIMVDLLPFFCMLPLSQGIVNQNIEFGMVPRSYTFLLLGWSVSQVAEKHWLFPGNEVQDLS